MSILDLWNTVVEKQMLQEKNGALRYDDDIASYEKRSGEKMYLFPLFLLYEDMKAFIIPYSGGNVSLEYHPGRDLKEWKRPSTVLSKYQDWTSSSDIFIISGCDHDISSGQGDRADFCTSFHDEEGNPVFGVKRTNGGSKVWHNPCIKTNISIRTKYGGGMDYTATEKRPVYIPLPASWLGDDRRCYCLTSDRAYTSYDVVCAINAESTRKKFKRILWSFVQNEEKINKVPGENDRIGKIVIPLRTKIEEEYSNLSPTTSDEILRNTSLRLKDLSILLYRLSSCPSDEQLEEITEKLSEL